MTPHTMTSTSPEKKLATGKEKKRRGDEEFRRYNKDGNGEEVLTNGMSTSFCFIQVAGFLMAFWLTGTALRHYHEVNASIHQADSQGVDGFECSRSAFDTLRMYRPCFISTVWIRETFSSPPAAIPCDPSPITHTAAPQISWPETLEINRPRFRQRRKRFLFLFPTYSRTR